MEVGADGLGALTFDLPGKSANIFTRGAIDELETVVDALARRTDIGCLVLLSAKPKIFIAGADIDEIAHASDPKEIVATCERVHRLFSRWESLPFPTVAAVRGACLGGGAELAVASTFIVTSDGESTKIGFPETRLGILPAWGGTTRLPRRIGIAAALDLILTGKSLSGRSALKLGLADALLPEAAFLPLVREFALAQVGRKQRTPRRRGLSESLIEGNPLGRAILFAQARKRTLATTHSHYPAPLRVIQVMRTAVARRPAAGFAAEARAAADLAASPISKNLVHVFRLMEASKRDDVAAPSREVRSAAVIGAGVMGGGIAHAIADRAQVPVRLRDINPQALALGMRHAAELFEKQVVRRRLTRPEARRRLAFLRPALDLSGLARCDLVIEAVVEKLELKQQVFLELGERTSPDAVLASNTSSLSIDAIAARTSHPERVVGMHFFHPVDKMPLVEVIASKRTAPGAAQAVAAFARRMGKTPIVVRDAPGFLVNRLLSFYMCEALYLLGEGVAIETIDGAMENWGMPLGPIALVDEVGIDVAMKAAKVLGEAFGARLAPSAGAETLIADGRLGAKSGRGFYLYSKRRRTVPDPHIYALLNLPARPGSAPSAQELVARMVLPMVNEAARCLEESVVRSAGDVDLAMILGTGFPPFRGGLCRWADAQGLATLIERLEHLARTVGERYAPSPALRAMAAAGGFYRSGEMR